MRSHANFQVAGGSATRTEPSAQHDQVRRAMEVPPHPRREGLPTNNNRREKK